jgi:hypothetical protein
MSPAGGKRKETGLSDPGGLENKGIAWGSCALPGEPHYSKQRLPVWDIVNKRVR